MDLRVLKRLSSTPPGSFRSWTVKPGLAGSLPGLNGAYALEIWPELAEVVGRRCLAGGLLVGRVEAEEVAQRQAQPAEEAHVQEGAARGRTEVGGVVSPGDGSGHARSPREGSSPGSEPGAEVRVAECEMAR